MSRPDPARPWLVRWRLVTPDASGRKVRVEAFTSKESALHTGQRLFDGGSPVVTVVHAFWPPNRRFIKQWTRPVPAASETRRQESDTP